MCSLVAALSLHGFQQGYADVTLRKTIRDNRPVFLLENYRVALRVDPSRGGAVISFRDKLGGNVELVPPSSRSGLCLDHFQAQTWPGELLDAPYQAEIVKQGPALCSLKCSYEVKGEWRGSSFPRLKGLLLEKTYALRQGSPALECRVTLRAPFDKSKLFAYWLQCVFFAGGTYDFDADRSFRPSARGIRVKSNRTTGLTGPEEFLKDFSDGWAALLDTGSKSGLVVLTDYNELKFVYVNGGNRTVEPMFRTTYLPAGASVEYTIFVIPVAGLANVVSATEQTIAGYQMTSDSRGNGSVKLSAVRSVEAPEKVAFDISVASVSAPEQTVEAGRIEFTDLRDSPQRGKTSFRGAGPDPLVLRVQTTVSSSPGKEVIRHSFEDFFPGAYKWAENIQTDMASALYTGLRPPRKLALHKPRPIRLANRWSRNVWFAEGLLDDFYGVTQAVRLTETYHDGRTLRNRAFISHSQFGTQLSSFPYDYDELLRYNYLVLGGLKKDSLGQVGLEMVSDFAGAGGGVVMLGGPMAYGCSGLRGTALEKLLPVEVSEKAFDLIDVGSAPVQIADRSAVFLMDIDFRAGPCVKYLHEVKVRPGARVILTAAGRPFLVVRELKASSARIACILGAPMGTLPQGRLPFWQWRDWKYLLRQIFWWVARSDHFFQQN